MMKQLLFILTLLFATGAFASDHKIDDNDFNCSYGAPGFELKTYWFEWLPSKIKRSYQRKIDCSSALKSYYEAGSIRFFKIVEQIKSLQNPSALATFWALQTKFNSVDAKAALKALRGLGVDPDADFNRLAITLLRLKNNSVEAESELEKFLDKTKSIPLVVFKKSYVALQDQNLGAEILSFHFNQQKNYKDSLKTKSQKLFDLLMDQKSAAELAEVSDDNLKTSHFNPISYLIHTRRIENYGKDLALKGELGLNLLSALSIQDAALAKQIFSQWYSIRSVSLSQLSARDLDVNLCSLILGEAVRGTPDYQKDMIELFERERCTSLIFDTGNFYHPGKPKYLLSQFPEHKDLTKRILPNIVNLLRPDRWTTDRALRELMGERRTYGEGLIRNCGNAEDIDILVSFEPSQLSSAIQAKCSSLIEVYLNRLADRYPQEAYFHIMRLESYELQRIGRDSFIQFALKLEAKGIRPNPAQLANITDAFGPDFLRQLKVVRRAHGAPARELISTAEIADDDQIMRLNWRGQTLELLASKLDANQVKLVDQLRQAQTEEEVSIRSSRSRAQLSTLRSSS